MLSRSKIEKHLLSFADDSNSERDRFIQDMLILIEFGQFDYDEDSGGELNE